MTRIGCTLLVLAFLLAAAPAPQQLGAGGTAHAQTEGFYLLRVTFTSTSDWADLTVLNPDILLSMRVQAVEGEVTRVAAQIDNVALDQSLERAEQGFRVQVTLDYVLDAAAIDQPLQLRLNKGGLNSTHVDIAVMVDGTPAPLTRITHPQSVPVVREQVDLSGLQAFQPQTLPPRSAAVPKMLWAFYYPWYRFEDWSSGQLRDRPQAQYSSDDPFAVERHIREAQSAGIDGFISSWWGPGDYTDQNLALLLDASMEAGFSVMIYFETLGAHDMPRSADEIYDWLAYFIATYRDHPAYMTLDGKPVIAVWVSWTVPLEVWDDIFTRLREEGLDAVYLAQGYDDVTVLDVFDGLHEYAIFTVADLEDFDARAGRSTRFYHILAGEDTSPKIWTTAVQPGFDNRLLGSGGLVQDREDGAYYRRTFDAALASEPDWIFIATWNEWWEHTYIEPSELYGSQYLDITREYADHWKGE
jgi:hypothetical protein